MEGGVQHNSPEVGRQAERVQDRAESEQETEWGADLPDQRKSGQNIWGMSSHS